LNRGIEIAGDPVDLETEVEKVLREMRMIENTNSDEEDRGGVD